MVAYEILFLTGTNLTPKVTSAFLRRCVRHIGENGGAVTALESLGRRTTAYRMKQEQAVHDEADHFLMRIECAPPVIRELSGYVTKDDRCIRHLVTRDKNFKLPKLKPYWDAVKRERKREEKARLRDLYVPEDGLRQAAMLTPLEAASVDSPHRWSRQAVIPKYEMDDVDVVAEEDVEPEGVVGDYQMNTRADNVRAGRNPNDIKG